MKTTMTALLLLAATAARAQLDRAGNVIESPDGGAVTMMAIGAAALVAGAIFFLLVKTENETKGFMYLVGAVLALIVASCVFK